ncbi:MAG: transglycosylase SLT domain-containing protein [Deltaproteobacteria bacterium]|nr:transglycosylase SLT domain-containing protein [Deltaproteobacteria bacterium]
MRLALLTVFAAVLSLAFPDARAAMYSYVDQYGVMHFTNVPADPRYKELPGFERIRITAIRGRYGQFIKMAADRYRLDPELIRAVIKVESSFNPFAVSKKGAMGLMQLMPETAKEMKVMEPFEARDNIMGGSRYLRKLLDQFEGDLRLGLAAYNAGPNRIIAGRIPAIDETEQYVKKVLYEYGKYRTGALAEQ